MRDQKCALGYINVILLRIDHWHVSATHVVSSGWWEQDYKCDYNVSESLYS